MKPVKNGILQGSPISPILTSFYSAGLLNIFETPTNPIRISENHACNHLTYVFILIYVDDKKLTVSSQLLDTNNYKDKRELMHYTWRKRDKISPHINLTNCDGTISTILVGSTICQLGVHFNCKLLYNYHVTKMAAKAENAVAYISMLANTVWGLSHYHLHLLYYTCILSIIIYTSAAWWTGKQKHIQILNKVQNRALCLICAVFHTTPTHALKLEASIWTLLPDILPSASTNLVLIILSSNDYQITDIMDRAPQILLLSLQNTTAGPNQHNYKKQLHSPLQPMNTFFPFFSPHGKKHSWTMENALQFTNVACHNSFVNQAQYYPETLLTYSDSSQIFFLN